MHKNKVVGGKALSFVIGRFCTCHSRLPFDREVLHGNDAFSVTERSNKKDYSSFLKKVSVSPKLLFKEKLMKTFKIQQKYINRYCHFLETLMLFLLALAWIPNDWSSSYVKKNNSYFVMRFFERSTRSNPSFSVYLMNHVVWNLHS